MQHFSVYFSAKFFQVLYKYKAFIQRYFENLKREVMGLHIKDKILSVRYNQLYHSKECLF